MTRSGALPLAGALLALGLGLGACADQAGPTDSAASMVETAAPNLLGQIEVRPGARIGVIYIAADNCPPCTAWERDIGRRSKSAFLAENRALRIEWTEIRARSFGRTNLDADWPPEWRFVRERTNVRSGTPRYLTLVDGKVVANTLGTYDFHDRTLLLLRQLAARRDARS
ncbi:MAG: hypothetical protein FJX46_03015 [Alphaproteobacteria bacterium]|nr:hypothetical protein [Alphaproteobacteria bacterium]